MAKQRKTKRNFSTQGFPPPRLLGVVGRTFNKCRLNYSLMITINKSHTMMPSPGFRRPSCFRLENIMVAPLICWTRILHFWAVLIWEAALLVAKHKTDFRPKIWPMKRAHAAAGYPRCAVDVGTADSELRFHTVRIKAPVLMGKKHGYLLLRRVVVAPQHHQGWERWQIRKWVMRAAASS